MEEGILKSKCPRVQRALKERAPKLIENDKKTLLIRGQSASQTVKDILKDLHSLKQPNSTLFWKKNPIQPFEDASSIEFLAEKNDTSLFAFASHSKKRPNNLVLGRTHDFEILDMIELGVTHYTAIDQLKGSKSTMASKPCLIFSGSAFETEEELRRLKCLLIDFFRGPSVGKVRLNGLEQVMHFSATETEVHMRSYKIALKKSGTRVPRIELEDMGPNMDFYVRRTRLAPTELYEKACRQVKVGVPKKVKNVSTDPFGTKHGRVHMQSQDLNALQLKKVKALKRKHDTVPNDVRKQAKSDSDQEQSE